MTPQPPSQTYGVLFKISKRFYHFLEKETAFFFFFMCLPCNCGLAFCCKINKEKRQKVKDQLGLEMVKDLTSQDRKANRNRTELAAGQRGH